MPLDETCEEKRLVVYLTGTNEKRPTSAELRAFLKDLLPRHMIPSEFVWMEQLPLTPNGKVDRQGLAAMNTEAKPEETEFVPPQTPTESALANIWKGLLHQSRIGRGESFFDLGGHSILAARMFTDIRKQLGKSLPLGTLFQNPTLQTLAAVIDQTDYVSSLVEIQAGGQNLPLFLVHGGNGGVFIFKGLAAHMGRDRPVYGIEAPWLSLRPNRHWTMEELAALYLQEIRKIQPHGPYHLGGYSQGGCIAFEMAQQLRREGDEVATLLMLDSANPQGLRRLNWRKQIAKIRRILAGQSFRQKIHQIAQRGWRKIERKLLVKLATIKISGKPVTSQLRQTDFANAQVQLLQHYQPQAYYGPMTLILCKEQLVDNLTYGWENVALGGLHVMRTDGSHDIMFQEPHVQTLARQVALALGGKP